jgi:hypothetical protein
MMDQEIARELLPLLTEGEELRWTGRPRGGLAWQAGDWARVAFGIAWMLFTGVWIGMSIGIGAPWFFTAFGIPFVVFGLYILVIRFFTDARRRSRTTYGITQHRVIVRGGMLDTAVDSYPLETLTDLRLEERADGTGTIRLRPDQDYQELKRYPNSHAPGHRYRTTTEEGPRLELIAQPQTVYRLLTELKLERERMLWQNEGEAATR